MSGIGSSSSYSVSAGTSNSSNGGISGLMSGMDTDALVEKMLSGTQAKIDKQEALKLQTGWKQDIYREIITSINSFYNSYFDPLYGSTLSNNFASASFFNSLISSITKGDALKVISTGSGASTGDVKVAVKELASNAEMTTDQLMSGDKTIHGKAITEDNRKAFEKSVSLKVGDKTVKVNLNNATSESEMVDAFNNQLAADGVTGVTAKIFEGRLRLVTDNPATKVTVDVKASSELGLKMTGMGSGYSSELKDTNGTVTGTMLQGAQVQPQVGVSFTMTLDGVAKTITLNKVAGADGTITDQSLADALQKEAKKAFGDIVKVEMATDADGKSKIDIKLDTTEKGHELNITGSDASKLGITPGSSTNVNMSTKLSALGATGDRFSFSINGTDFTFQGSDSLGTVINKINNSDAGVRITYSTLSDTFKMESSSTGSRYGIDIQQKEGDLFGVMFGTDKVASAGSAASSNLTTKFIQGKAGGLASDFTTDSISMKITVNGVQSTFSLPKVEDKIYTASEIQTSLNTWLMEKYGSADPDDAANTANISWGLDGKLSTAKGFEVSFAATTVDLDNAEAVAKAEKSDLALALGFNRTATSNVAKADANISDIHQFAGMNFTKADGTAATTVGDIASFTGAGGTVYDVKFSGGKLVLSGSGNVNLSAETDLKALFGKDLISFGDGKTDATKVKKGQDAVLLVNGTEITRSSNTVTVEGLTMELTKKSSFTTAADGTTRIYDETVVSTSRDTEKIVGGFKSFVEDYNKMLEKLNGYMDEDADYKDYPPLTAAQKKDMSDSEVKLWEEKAKKGLVRRDSTVQQFLSEMRTSLYTKPAGSKFALYDIGIETTTNYKDKGKLQFNEAALRNALASDPDSVRNLFMDATGGLSQKLMDSMNKAAKTTGSAKGTLVQLAGVKGGASEKSNTLYDRITDINQRIKDLKYKYQQEKARYWNQFNAMESVMAQYNSQSMWMTQQFGG